MSETGELPCLYCGAEPPPSDEHGLRTCCLGGRHADEAGRDLDTLARALNFYADPRSYHLPDDGEAGGPALLQEVTAGAQAELALRATWRLDTAISNLRTGLPACGCPDGQHTCF